MNVRQMARLWVCRGELNPVAQFDGDGNLELLFVYAGRGNVPSLMVTADGDVLRVLADQLGSVRRIVHVASYSGGIGDEGGVLTTGTGETWFEARYSPFGVIEEETARAGFDQPFRFAGGHWDAETQLIRFGARDYDPEVGRWTSKDPIRFDGGVNLYAYANNAPHMYVDPNGHEYLKYGVSFEISLFFGFTAEVGFYGGGTDSNDFDFGVFYSGTGTFGLDIGSDVSAGLSCSEEGNVEDVSEKSNGFSGSAFLDPGGVLSFSRTDPDTGANMCTRKPVNEYGFRVGLGAEAGFLGGSSQTYTASLMPIYETIKWHRDIGIWQSD